MQYSCLWVILGLVVGTLGVSRPPTMLKNPPKKTAFVVQEARVLECVADAEPAPSYTWYKNGKIFNTGANAGRYSVWPGRGTLIFVRPQMDDDGYYQCMAENQFGKSLSIKTDLRRAEFNAFDTARITSRINRGYPTTLNCRKPTSYPPPKISWRYEKGGTIKNVIEDARHAIDIYGNLNFANVQKEDDGNNYYCVATNDLIGREERSKYKTMKVGNKDQNPNTKVRVMATSATDITGLMNASTEFICIFSGNPTPTINWEFIDSNDKVQKISSLPGMRVDKSGVRLFISRIMLVHKGTYRCKGVNPNSNEVTREFRLTVRSKPYWIKKPVNTMAPPGSSHTFECIAGGDPKPTISWFVNGRSPDLYTNARRRIVSNNRFVLTDLKSADTAVIQCNATNNFGYAFADAYINVVREPPSFIQTMNPLTKKAEGQSIILNCSTYSAPPAIPKWTRVDRNQQLTGGRYSIMAGGNLKIPSLMVSDSGTYRCDASNLFGSVTTQGKLIVRRRTRITVPPKDVRVYENSEVKFVCSGSTDPLEVKNLKIKWEKDRTPIDLAKQTRVRRNPADNSLIIGGVRPMDTGTYTCVVYNSIDEARASAQLVVQGRPDQPRDIVVDCTSKSASRIAVVNWKAGADNSAPILKYEIEFAVSKHPNTWYPADLYVAEKTDSSDKEAGGATTSAEVLMRPGLTYLFRVRARNIVGLSEPSEAGKNKCPVNPAAPTSNPTNLWAEGTQRDNIIVHWTPMSEFEQNGNELQYIVKINCENCVNMPKAAVNTTHITNWRDTNLPFIKAIRVGATNFQVEQYKKYKVSIKSRNVVGHSTKAAVEAYGYSGEGPPTVKLTGLNSMSGSGKTVDKDNQITLKWTAPTDLNTSKEVNGFFRGYRVEWCEASLSTIQCEKTKRYQDHILYFPKHPLSMTYRRRRRSVDNLLHRVRRATTTVQMTLNRLPGSANLKAWVRILNKRFAGPISNIITFQTAVGVPGPVEAFQTKAKGVTHLSFKWQKPSQTNGNLTGYQLGVQMIKGLDLGYLKRFPEISNPSMLDGEVVGLKPNSRYRIFIWARSSAGMGVANFVDEKTSPANVAPGKPTIRIESIGVSSVNVSFAPSAKGVPGSVFYVQYRLPGRAKWEESQREFSQRWIQVTDMPTDTVYHVRVVATNGAGLTAFSETVIVRTGGSKGPNSLAGASATWFIIMICLLLLLIGGIVGLVYLRKKRLLAIQGKPVPQEDPDGPGRYGSPPTIPTLEMENPSQPTKEDPPMPSTTGSVGHHYANVPFRGGEPSVSGSINASGVPPPVYSEAVRSHSPPEDEEWSPPKPGRRRMIQPSSGSIERLDRDRPPQASAAYDPHMASPVPSSAGGGSVNPSSTII